MSYAPWQTVTRFHEQAELLVGRRYGRIEVAAGRLREIQLRPTPKLVSLVEVYTVGRWYHRRASGDRAWLYYNEPWTSPGYLALAYALSTRDCSWQTARAGLLVLDEIARLKQSRAIVCEAAGSGLTDRLARRYGYERHLCESRRRHFIRRFYGAFPPVPAAIERILQGSPLPSIEPGRNAKSETGAGISYQPSLTER